MAVRKRKAQEPHAPTPPPATAPSRLEEKLDDLVSLLRSQAAEKQSQASEATAHSTPNGQGTPSTTSTFVGSTNSITSTPARDPDVVIDTATGVVHLLPSKESNQNPDTSPSPLLEDVAVHRIQDRIADDQLSTFRRAFLSVFPLAHIPATMSASDLYRQRPFLWLVVMCLTTKQVSQQFAMEETFWLIVSRKVVSQHYANLDLLLGIVCFGSWYVPSYTSPRPRAYSAPRLVLANFFPRSHYFKKDKPFMGMLAQLAVSIAFDLGLHRDAPANTSRRLKSGRLLTQEPSRHQARSIEDRRTILAVYHLTSS